MRETLDRHLQAIQARDLDALLATVTRGDALTLILPDGRVLDTREEYRRLHQDWFAEDDWRMRFEVRQVREFGETGIALVHYLSQQRQADGSYATGREALLSLLFAREQGDWRLVYDQNTVVPPQRPQ
nr:SgcJ/EcaC family oxidoreductase [Luteimonas salinisoli]